MYVWCMYTFCDRQESIVYATMDDGLLCDDIAGNFVRSIFSYMLGRLKRGAAVECQ